MHRRTPSSFILGWELSSSIVSVHRWSISHWYCNEIGYISCHNIHQPHPVMISIITCLITHNFTSSAQSLFKASHRVLNVFVLPTTQPSHQYVIQVLWDYSLHSKYLILIILILINKGSYCIIIMPLHLHIFGIASILLPL